MLTIYAKLILFTTTIAVLLPLSYAFELPFLQSCTIEDEKCHIEHVNKFFAMYGKGIKELDVPTLDPMHLGDIRIKGNTNENFKLELLMANVELFKYPEVNCLSIKGFSKDSTKPIRIVLKVFSAELIIKTHCKINGNILLFPVAGETNLKVNMKNVTTTFKVRVAPYTKDGLTYYKVEELKPKLDIGSLKTTFTNSSLLNGDEIFVKTLADTINDNWEVLRDEIEPHLTEAVGKVEIEILNKILPTMPYNKLFKKSD